MLVILFHLCYSIVREVDNYGSWCSIINQSGVEKLKQEKEQLINVERPKVIEELQLARSQGDLSENADYDAARDKQAHIEARIKEIDQMLLHVQIIDESNRIIQLLNQEQLWQF